jgi:metal-responsive CopG/Arc/MetJ family transcriptional regulator
MSAQPVQISLDRELLKRLDADPEVKARGRSAFIRDALRAYLRARERARVDDQIRAAYVGRANAMLREVESLLESQSWPDD